MSKKQDRINIVKKINKAAALYKQHLIGKKFMYVFEGKYIEVVFKAENFRHLTGVDTNLSAKQFYDYASKGKLTGNQIWFGPAHPYSLCIRKIQHICDIATMVGGECVMLENITTTTNGYKFGITDLKLSLCLNKELDDGGNEKSECYVAQSSRDEDCFSKSKNAYIVTHIFSKQNDMKKYQNLLYIDKSSNIDTIPNEIVSMLEPTLYQMLSII